MSYSASASKQLPLSSYKRVIAICCAVAFGGFQYGFDNQSIAGMQAMVGFLKVFGYEAPELPLGWNITVYDL
jgi:MFS transporter, SP family, sugar:H+ symporter